jgi:prepilin-type N-terminal cleavage/methylation domain-containing protein
MFAVGLTEARIRAFTLVEMLVSVAVLVLILVFATQMMNMATISTGLSNKHGDADSQARTVFDRIARDFAGMPQRQDIDFLFEKQQSGSTTSGSNDEIFFYSEAPAFTPWSSAMYPTNPPDPKSSVALIGYCVNTGINNTGAGNPAPPAHCLQRLSKGLTWDENAFLTFQQPGTVNSSNNPYTSTTIAGNAFTSNAILSAPPSYSGTGDSAYDVLSPEVFRLEFCFQVKDLTNPATPAAAYSIYPMAFYAHGNAGGNTRSFGPSVPTTANVGDRWYDTQNFRAFACTGINGTTPLWSPIGLADVSAIVVAIAILDTNSRKIVTQNQLAAAASALADFTEPAASQAANPPLMATTWENTINSTQPTFSSLTGLSPTAAGQVRIYQRYFYLNNY